MTKEEQQRVPVFSQGQKKGLLTWVRDKRTTCRVLALRGAENKTEREKGKKGSKSDS